MLRLATPYDIPSINKLFFALKAQTGWAQVHEQATDAELYDFTLSKLQSPTSVCYVWDDGDIRSFCGASLSHFYIPPYMPTVFEWGWAGPPKLAVTCWRACCDWGRKHGAAWAGRVTGKPGMNPDKVTESITWERL